MGIFSRLFRHELRAEVVTADDKIMSILRTIEITPKTALEIPAVSACIELISAVIAALPVKLYRDNRTENKTEEIKDDARLRLLNDETGDLLDPFQMKKAVISDYFLYGSGYIYPEMLGNRCISLRYVPHDAVSSCGGVDAIFKTGEYYLSNGLRLRDDELIRMLHNTRDGLKGESFILAHQQLFTTMYREIVYEKHLVTNGGNKKGFLTSESKLDPEMMSDLRRKWNEMYANTGNTMMVLNKGLSFHESSNTSVEMQLRENKNDNNSLACQVFGLSPDAVSGRLTDDQFASMIKTAAAPIITTFENALDVGLLLPSERDNYYFILDTAELTKGDILKRYQAYKTGLECNVLQIDEARYKEDLPPLGLNWIKLGLQDVLYDPKTKMIYTPNMNQSMQMSEKPLSLSEKGVDNSGEGGIIEERGKDNYIQDPTTGQMMGSTGGSGGGKSSGNKVAVANNKTPTTEQVGTSAKDSGKGNIEITDEAIDNVPMLDVFGDDEKNKRYQQANKDLLSEAQKYPVGTELSRIYDKNMNPIKDHDYVVGDKPGQVKIDDVDIPYHAFHNHPSGETLSPEDLMNISSKNNMVSLTATGNNAKLFSIVKTESADSYGYVVFLRDKVTEKRFFNKSFSYLDVKEFDLDQLPENLSKPLRDELLSFCKECVSGGKNYGYSYFKS